jgi:hypothetical protein
MLALRELQGAMRSALLGGSDALIERVVLSDGLAPGARLAIYRHHVETTLTEALASAFPVVRRLVDPRFFAYAADRYLRAHPPESPCLFEFGASFPDFLAGFPACRPLAYLRDVARLEWALHSASHADDAGPIDPSRLGEVPDEAAERLVLQLAPALSWLRSAWPLDAIWAAHQPGGRPEDVELSAGGVRLEIGRSGDVVRFHRARAGDFAFRSALGAGMSIARAAGLALAEEPEFDLAAALAALLREGVVVGFDIERGEAS